MALLFIYLNFLEYSGPCQFCNGTAKLYLITWNHLGHARTVMGLLNIYHKFLEPSGPCQACNDTALRSPVLPGTLWVTPGINGTALTLPNLLGTLWITPVLNGTALPLP